MNCRRRVSTSGCDVDIQDNLHTRAAPRCSSAGVLVASLTTDAQVAERLSRRSTRFGNLQKGVPEGSAAERLGPAQIEVRVEVDDAEPVKARSPSSAARRPSYAPRRSRGRHRARWAGDRRAAVAYHRRVVPLRGLERVALADDVSGVEQAVVGAPCTPGSRAHGATPAGLPKHPGGHGCATRRIARETRECDARPVRSGYLLQPPGASAVQALRRSYPCGRTRHSFLYDASSCLPHTGRSSTIRPARTTILHGLKPAQ